MNVLNQELYARLKLIARGPVKVSNFGQKMIFTDSPSLFAERGDERCHLEIMQDGEYYSLNCRYCNDTRFRLYVNHMYGTKVKKTGRVLRFLAICYNEGCMRRKENQDDLWDDLSDSEGGLEEARIAPGSVLSSEARVARWPGPMKKLSDLPVGHKARRYVESRRFDPDRLSRFYDVRYCVDSMYHLAADRLVVPIYEGTKLIGWQSRYVGELNWKGPKRGELPPKYWTMPGLPKGSILANFDNAKLFRTGVLVEGWFDVFGFGPMAMPVLGNTVTDAQIRKFVSVFRRPGRSGVLLLDPEEFGSASSRKVTGILTHKMSGQFAAVRLPAGTDPGKLDRGFLRDYVREEAADQGVKISYDMVKET